jgi:S-adenosylmethionine hydrolase
MRLANGRLLVGPDNGLLWPAAEQAGGVTEAVDIACSPYRLQPVSATFHGRDIFAPVAAGLADGVALADVGERCDPGELVRLVLPVPRLEDRMLVAHAVYVDRFGKVQLDAPHVGSGLEPGRGVTLELPSGETHRALFVATFADVAQGELLVYEDAHRMLAVAINRGNAAERLGIVVDDELAMRSE